MTKLFKSRRLVSLSALVFELKPLALYTKFLAPVPSLETEVLELRGRVEILLRVQRRGSTLAQRTTCGLAY